MNKRGQVTVFIIIALIIIGVAIFFIILRQPSSSKSVSAVENPQAYFRTCIQEKAEKIVDDIMLSGGNFSYQGRIYSRLYEENNVTFLCYTRYDNELCVNQHPMLKTELEIEIKKQTKKEIENCFVKLKDEIGNNNYIQGQTNLNVEIVPDKILFKIDKEISFDSAGISLSYNTFNFNLASKAFDFARLATEISNQELDCDCELETCRADTLALSLANREFEIGNLVYDNNGKIYVINETARAKEFRFAIRNCIKTL